ncbi:MAG: guanylate kinase [Candidatus ainarchaeum sp.]|nr:guanylate kinase [Candidatus ainarchaeum sp.]
MFEKTTNKKIGKIILFSGPSGAGKTTIANKILDLDKSFKKIVTCTTRAPRIGEIDGQDYHFLSKDQFLDLIKKDEFIEYAVVYDNYYGSLKKEVLDIINSGKNVLFVVDIVGALTIKKKFPESISFFIKTNDLVELENRLIKRGKDTPNIIKQRLTKAIDELKVENKFDYIIENNFIADTTKKIITLIKNHN